MKKPEQKPLKGLAAMKYRQIEGASAPQRTIALAHVEAALDEGLAESFPASDPLAIDTRPPEQGAQMRAGLRAMQARDISCIIEYEKFIIELNAEQRSAEWFPAFQVVKDGIVVVPWTTPTVPASPTKQAAIEVAAERAVTDIRGGLATAFS